MAGPPPGKLAILVDLQHHPSFKRQIAGNLCVLGGAVQLKIHRNMICLSGDDITPDLIDRVDSAPGAAVLDRADLIQVQRFFLRRGHPARMVALVIRQSAVRSAPTGKGPNDAIMKFRAENILFILAAGLTQPGAVADLTFPQMVASGLFDNIPVCRIDMTRQ